MPETASCHFHHQTPEWCAAVSWWSGGISQICGWRISAIWGFLKGGLFVWLRFFDSHDHTIWLKDKVFGTEKNSQFMLKMKIPLILTGCFIGTGLVCLVSCETVQRFFLDISS